MILKLCDFGTAADAQTHMTNNKVGYDAIVIIVFAEAAWSNIFLVWLDRSWQLYQCYDFYTISNR